MKYSDYLIYLYLFSIFIIDVIYIAVFLGIFVNIPYYIKELNFIVQVFLCFMLMYRFNPFRTNAQIQKYDVIFIFGAATFLFTNVILVEIIKIPLISTYINQTLSFWKILTHDIIPNSTTTPGIQSTKSA